MTVIPLLSATAQASLAAPVHLVPGTIVHSADRQDLGVVTGESPDERPEGAVAFVVWHPWTCRETRGWVTADEVTTRPLSDGVVSQ